MLTAMEAMLRTKYRVCFALLLIVGIHTVAQDGQPSTNVDELALQVAGKSDSPVRRATRLVQWINTNFEWTDTDYQQRTPEQIIERRGGNCAELSRVLARLLQSTGIRYRWVAEINIHPYSRRRQKSAERKMKEKGNRMSVFGVRHNDHRWLEVYDNESARWVPADPSVGVVGVSEWIALRMGLEDRPKPAVPAMAKTLKDMIVPFAVIAPANELNPIEEDRSEYYLIDQFNAAYGGELSSLPAWKDWSAEVRELSVLAAGAFKGTVNLHESDDGIEKLAATYAELRTEARASGITLVSASK